MKNSFFSSNSTETRVTRSHKKNICVPLRQSATSRYFLFLLVSSSCLAREKKETDEMNLSTTRKKVKRLLSLYTEVQKDTTNGRTIFGWLECDRYCYSRDDHRDHRCFASVKARKTLFAPAEVNARVLNFFFLQGHRETPPTPNRQQRERERGKKHASLPKPSSSLFVRLEKFTFARASSSD